MSEDYIEKSDLFEYSFYDEDNKLVTVLNEDLLKRIFKSDIILLDEKEYR